MPRTPAQPGVDRRQQILESALDAFAEHGFEGATTTQIAAKAGATQGLIYFYFPKGKEDLFTAAFEHQANLFFDELDFAEVTERDDPPAVALRRMIGRFVSVMSSARNISVMRVMMRTMANASVDDERLEGARQCGTRRFQRFTAQLAAYFQAQIERGAMRPVDVHLAARLIVGGLMTLLRAVKVDGLGTYSPDDLAEQIATIYLHGLVPVSAETT